MSNLIGKLACVVQITPNHISDLQRCVYGSLLRSMGSNGFVHVESGVRDAIQFVTGTGRPPLTELPRFAKSALLLILARGEGHLWGTDGLNLEGLYLSHERVVGVLVNEKPLQILTSQDLFSWQQDLAHTR